MLSWNKWLNVEIPRKAGEQAKRLSPIFTVLRGRLKKLTKPLLWHWTTPEYGNARSGVPPDPLSLTVRGRWPGSLSGPFGLVFLLCGSLTRPAGGVDVRSSIQGILGMERVS